MKLNVGNLESFFRIFIGVVLLYAALHAYVGDWGYVGVLFIATGLSRWSPLRAILGMNGYETNDDGGMPSAHHSSH